MKNFTVEEINLMCCFNTSSRKRLIDDMKGVTLNDMDGEIAELMYKTIRKLEAMTDTEFEELYNSYCLLLEASSLITPRFAEPMITDITSPFSL